MAKHLTGSRHIWQIVHNVNGGVSSTFPLKQGVIQGSCLGPILFTLYTSKLFGIVEKHLPSIRSYADDSVIFSAQPECAR